MATHAARITIARASSIAMLILLTPMIATGQTSQPPVARFDWSMPDHFGAMSGALMDFHWNEDAETYASDYINPSSWRVDFNACASTPGSASIQQFVWTFSDLGVVKTSDSCLLVDVMRFPEQERRYRVSLTVKASDGQQSSTTQTVFVRDWLIVSMGDSIASGEGNPDIQQVYEYGVVKAGPRWEDRRCHRSSLSGHAQAALQIERADPHTSVTFISFACSGAGITNGLLNDYAGVDPDPPVPGTPTLPSQIFKVGQAIAGRHIDAVIMSIGANDVGFHTIVERTIRDNPTNLLSFANMRPPGPLPGGLAVEGFDDPLVKNIPFTQLSSLYGQLSERMNAYLRDARRYQPPSRVYITEYPDITHAADGRFCNYEPLGDLLYNISGQEAQWASQSVVAPLNQTVHDAAVANHWKYVDAISSSFGTHGYCSGANRWVNTEEDARWKQGDYSSLSAPFSSSGMVHPNERGQQHYAARLVQEMKLSTRPAVTITLNPGAQAGTNVSITVAAKDTSSDQFVTTARWLIDDDPAIRAAGILYTLHLDGMHHTLTVFDDRYADARVAFDLPLQDMALSLDHFVTLDTLTAVTVFAKDAGGNAVNGSVTITSPGAKATDPAFTGPSSNAATIANYPTKGIFRARVVRYTDPNGDLIVSVAPPTATVTAPNFKPATIVLIDQ